MAMSAEHRSNLQPFTGNIDASIWVKNSRLGRKTPNKQANQLSLPGLFYKCHQTHQSRSSNLIGIKVNSGRTTISSGLCKTIKSLPTLVWLLDIYLKTKSLVASVEHSNSTKSLRESPKNLTSRFTADEDQSNEHAPLILLFGNGSFDEWRILRLDLSETITWQNICNQSRVV